MEKTLNFRQVLVAFLGFIMMLIACRIYFSGSLLFIFLLWNIFLAWLPYMLSAYLSEKKPMAGKTRWAVFLGWLLFFPNSLYIVTDLVHLEIDTSIPKWFDTILLFSSSIMGLMMAFVSLFRTERFLIRQFGKRPVPYLMGGILFLGSFGVYLGRFLRWNSWDVISHPVGLLAAVAKRVVFPFDHLYTWGVTLLLTMLFYLLYMAVKNIPAYAGRE